MGFNCMACKNEDNDDMVACDECSDWYHFICVGVDHTIADRPWSCSKCNIHKTSKDEDNSNNQNKKQLPPTSQSEKPPTSQSEKPPGSPKEGPPNKDTRDDESVGGSSKLKPPIIISKSDNQSLTSKKRALLLQRLEEERRLQEKRDAEFLEKKYALLELLSSSESEVDDLQSQSKSDSVNPSELPKPQFNSTFHLNKNPIGNQLNDTRANSLSVNASVYNSHGEGPTRSVLSTNTSSTSTLPSKEQMAARQIMSKEHITFSGRIEEWPRFISWFNSTTVLCGYSTSDNLRRLQSCLKGDAYKTVGMRLFFPEQVPGVMKSLQQLYGRPEDIIDDLIEKIRKEPSPKMDKLQSIIQFSLAVENACAIMSATGMSDHLSNPSLVREFVEKLPPQIRLTWGSFRKTVENANLAQFSEWLAEVASSASQVTRMNSSTRTDKYVQKPSLNFHDNSASSSSDIKKCPICKSSFHPLEQCERFVSLSLNEKWDAIKRNIICRTCLRQHGRNRCRLDKPCGTDGCTYKHHKLLHKEQETSVEGLNCHQNNKSQILFRIVPVTLHHEDKCVETFAFLDDGSSISLMDESIATKLGVSGETKPLCLKWTANTHRTESSSKVVSVQISSMNSKKKYDVKNIRTVKSLGLPTQTIKADELAFAYPHLQGIPLSSYTNAKPQILLGLDQWKLTIPLRSRESSENHPAASKTRLGWTVFGPCQVQSQVFNNQEKKLNFHLCDCQENDDEKLSLLFKEFMALDSIGKQNKTVLRSTDDERAMKIIEHNIFKEEKHFVVPLLWRDEQYQMPDSRPMAVRRLVCLEKRMERDKQMYEKINTQIKEYIQKGYARKIEQQEIQQQFNNVWYLPIFPVVNHNKPNKLRIVWDAAAEVNNVSLNSCLFSGPDIVPLLVSVLFRFRERRVAVCADIKEMFHQVKIRKADQHAQRFLWRNEETRQVEEFIMQVMTFGSTCSPFCAQYVKNENAKRYEKQYPRAVKGIVENHYVDDYLDSFDSEEEAMRCANEIIFIHKEGGFDIRNFLSNSTKVVNSLQEKAANFDKKMDNWSNLSGPEKILGMWWSPSSDLFSFTIRTHNDQANVLAEDAWPTKRQLLKVLMSVFDPLGLIANFLVLLKILLQEVWSSGIEWDERIQQKHLEKWNKWKSFIPDIKRVVIDRPYARLFSLNNNASVQMHIFVDASELAYCAVGYFRIFDGKDVKISLVASKTKVAPLKMISIPRLELEAALLGVKLARIITEGHSIKISGKHFWSDSRTVLSWINSDHRKYKQFVAFRVGEILESTEVKDWRWVSSKINIADQGTKWQGNTEFHSDSRWYRGPDFLRGTIDEWPKEFKSTQQVTEEIRYVHLHDYKFESFIDVTKFSTWHRLLRTLAQVFRYLRRSSIRRINTSAQKCLINVDFIKAENYCFRTCQQESFGEEIIALTNCKNKQVEQTSKLFKLSPYLDEENLLRVKGRIDAAYGVSLDSKRPIILDSEHYVTTLIITDCHTRFLHQNDETVINELRQRYFIPKLRSRLKRIKQECQTCKINRSLPRPPIMGELPAARLQMFTRPFSYIGIDYFGPLLVTVGRHSEKRWGVLITCMTVRAIHVEVAHSLSTDACIMALNRFIARRGRPIEIFSDNGTNFRGASSELKEVVRQIDVNKMAEQFTSAELKWNFIPPASPHMGGSWERLVRSVKKTLSCLILTRNPTDELLLTMLAEVERIVNARPLIYVPLDHENEEALTPNHFLLGSSNGIRMSGELSDDGVLLRRNWLASEQFANRFWKRWVREYLPDLTRRTKWYSDTKAVGVGDVVVVVDADNPRNTWPKGIITSVYPGKDGNVRSAAVKTTTGTYTRPTVKLAVLDIGQRCESGKPIHETALPGGSVAKSGSTQQVFHSGAN